MGFIRGQPRTLNVLLCHATLNIVDHKQIKQAIRWKWFGDALIESGGLQFVCNRM